jgi:hypothetical protein
MNEKLEKSISEQMKIWRPKLPDLTDEELRSAIEYEASWEPGVYRCDNCGLCVDLCNCCRVRLP